MYCSSVGDLEFLCSRRRRGSSSRPGVHVITHPKSHRCEPNETCHKWKVTHGAPLWSVVVRQVRALVATRNARSNARMHRGEPTARHTDHPTHNNASITLHVPVKDTGEPGHTRDIRTHGDTGYPEPGKKTPGGAGTHTGHTGTRAHGSHTDEPHNHPNPPTHGRRSRPYRGRLKGGHWHSPCHGRYRYCTGFRVSVSCVSRLPPVSLNRVPVRLPPVSFYRYSLVPVSFYRYQYSTERYCTCTVLFSEFPIRFPFSPSRCRTSTEVQRYSMP